MYLATFICLDKCRGVLDVKECLIGLCGDKRSSSLVFCTPSEPFFLPDSSCRIEIVVFIVRRHTIVETIECLF